MIKVKQTSLYVLNKLESLASRGDPSELDLYVHSVYERTINLMLDNQLLALQIQDSPVSPISVILPINEAEIHAIGVHDGDAVTLRSNNLTVGKATISFDAPTCIYDGYLIKHNHKDDLKSTVKHMIENTNRGGFSFLTDPAGAPDDFVLSYAKDKLTDAVSSLKSGDTASSGNALTSLIGLGSGLTPGGDDFLTGMLSTFAALPARFNHKLMESVRAAITDNLDNTNEISRAFIKCALASQFSVPVITLYDELCTGAEAVDKLTKDFLAIGHSSGIDTLTGIWWSLEYLTRKAD